MPPNGMTVTEKQEGLIQLVTAAVLSAVILLIFFGNSWFGWLAMPTPYSDALLLALIGVGIAGVVWRTIFMDKDRDPRPVASMFCFAISMLPVAMARENSRVVATVGIAAVAVATVCGLVILARRRWGAQ
jgi:hypothetical protein